MLKIEFKTDVDGFQYSTGELSTAALADKLTDIGNRIQNYYTEGVIKDGNGNTVGEWSLTKDCDQD